MTAQSTHTAGNLVTARNYLQAIERGATGEALAQFFTSDVVQELFPNKLAPQGGRFGLPQMLAAAEKGRQMLSSQHYEIQREMESGNRVSLEVLWTGTLAGPVAGLQAGAQMRAHFALFLEFRDGKIPAQRNYDYFDPW
ncbi:MAG: nuclear transport factor 2 family protein [Candidatus Acidiferrales bacterium]